MRNLSIAAAVAAALGIGGAALAAPPTPTGAMSAAHNVYMAGSSAAVNGVLAYIEATVCGGSGWSLFTTPTSTTGNPDFRAVSCSPVSGQPFSGSTMTVWYRPEGGSVVGVFPVVNNTTIKQLNMTNAGCGLTTSTSSNATSATYNCTSIAGVTPANGTDDSFGPNGVTSHTVDIGVSDLEPGVFAALTGATAAWAGGGANDPVGTYSSAFTGADQSVDTVQAMTHFIPFQQVFGFIVSTNLAITDLPKEQIAAIFDGLVNDWTNVSTGASSTGHVTSASTPIVVCNRELGSGTRASADVFLNGTGCNTVGTVSGLAEVQNTVVRTPGGTITEPGDNFQTAAELDCVNGHNNAIGYVSIDKFPSSGNSNKITVSGATASQIAAATGAYSYVYEASINQNASASSDGTAFYTALSTNLPPVNNVPKSGQILAIPGIGSPANTAKIPLQQGSPSTEFTSLYSRNPSTGNSCTPLTDSL